jgi:hypothetical protein
MRNHRRLTAGRPGNGQNGAELSFLRRISDLSGIGKIAYPVAEPGPPRPFPRGPRRPGGDRPRAHDLVASSAKFLEAGSVGVAAGSAVPVDLQNVLGTASFWTLAQLRDHARTANRRWTLTSFASDARRRTRRMGVNAQVAVPAGGQPKVSTLRWGSAGFESGSSLGSGLSHSVGVSVRDDGVAVV